VEAVVVRGRRAGGRGAGVGHGLRQQRIDVAIDAVPPGGCTTGPNTTTIVIANNAVCPQRITIARGTQVTFVNQDSRPHEMYSDPHPEHTDCPELNQVGHLEPGQSRQSGNLNIARDCGFHDHINFELTALQGTITIQ
jgi:plastocyanin